MNGAKTSQNDEYLSTVFPVRKIIGEKTYFITKITPLFDSKVHHMVVNGCSSTIPGIDS